MSLAANQRAEDDEFGDEVLALEAELIGEAEAATGLRDWGHDDSFRTGLRHHIADQLDLPPVPATALRFTIVTLLGQLLGLVEDARRAPAILEEEISRPVFIVGPPRSGTTYVHSLLALDPTARAPLVWEAAYPSPPTDVATFGSDPRIARLGASMEEMMRRSPELRDIHMMKPANEAECEQFLEWHFSSLDIWASFDLRRTGRWLASGAHGGIYAAHRRMLQQFQWRGPGGRWTLKSPDHLFCLPWLLRSYPDACLIQTHRDPAKTLVSHASLILALRRLAVPETKPLDVGREVVEVWANAYNKAAEFRRDPAVRAAIYDIAYGEVTTDPIGSVRRIHQHFDLPFSQLHEQRIKQKIEVDKKERASPHRYEAEDFGITSEMTAFADYRSAFGAYL